MSESHETYSDKVAETYSEFMCTPNGNGLARCRAKYDVTYDANRKTFVYGLVPFSLEIIEYIKPEIATERRKAAVITMPLRAAA